MGPLGFALCALVEKLIPIIPSSGLLMTLGRFTVADSVALVGAIIATTVGSTLGSLAWYGLGRSLGLERSARLLAFGFLTPARLERVERLQRAYLRRRLWVTFLSQTIPIIRVYIAIPAGVLSVPFTSFVPATFAGALVWNSAFLLAGFMLRVSPLQEGHGNMIALIVGALLAAEAIIAVGIRLVRGRREQV